MGFLIYKDIFVLFKTFRDIFFSFIHIREHCSLRETLKMYGSLRGIYVFNPNF